MSSLSRKHVELNTLCHMPHATLSILLLNCCRFKRESKLLLGTDPICGIISWDSFNSLTFSFSLNLSISFTHNPDPYNCLVVACYKIIALSWFFKRAPKWPSDLQMWQVCVRVWVCVASGCMCVWQVVFTFS